MEYLLLVLYEMEQWIKRALGLSAWSFNLAVVSVLFNQIFSQFKVQSIYNDDVNLLYRMFLLLMYETNHSYSAPHVFPISVTKKNVQLLIIFLHLLTVSVHGHVLWDKCCPIPSWMAHIITVSSCGKRLDEWIS